MEQPYILPRSYTDNIMSADGDFRSQGISRHGIDTQTQNISSPASEELIGHQNGQTWQF